MIEFGSDFHYSPNAASGTRRQYFDARFSLFVSGRAALYHLVTSGIAQGWRKLFVPTYYCHEVTEFIGDLDIAIEHYDFVPGMQMQLPQNVDTVGNAIISVNYFGMIRPGFPEFDNAVLIEDLTHSVAGIQSSNADYCFGSLRKELPVPCGGFLYSPKNLTLPIAEISEAANAIAVKKLTAMFLKAEYLDGRFQDKPYFRELFAAAEHLFATIHGAMPNVAKAVLDEIEVESVLSAKKTNIAAALDYLDDERYNFNTRNTGLGLIITCESVAQRDELRNLLISNNIFPAVLWPDQKTDGARLLSTRILFIHMDFRYTVEQTLMIAQIVKTFFA